MTDDSEKVTKPKRKLREAKRDGLFVTDAELIEKLNVPEMIARARSWKGP